MSSREYPAWFWRLRDLQQDREARGQQNRYYDPDWPVEPKDFDEDLAECSDDSEESCSSEKGCTYDEDDMCVKHGIDDQSSESSELSGVSGETSATEAAQGMSERQNESVVEEALQAEIKIEEGDIQKVKAALAKTENSSKKKSGPLKSLEDRLFRLFCTDHIQYCYHATCPITYIEFYAPEDSSLRPDDSGRREPVESHVYLIHGDACNVDPFVRPKYPSTKFHQLKVDRGRRTVEIQFFHEYFLPPMDAPEIFTYYGYDEDYNFPDDRRKEKAKRRRSASSL
ncbi:hypothetical protein FPCIR_2556 [Fusarium pseudocircinatum]|uniref:Uncharacterized protein n=1 Tax=Fusarium pseudocircinatum TaxID=56676 RepID=A0A8H5PLN3_9HYPO|nr:hypothetical protein FPCIR_2556 [Fusarium pseudocircinatum]